MHTFDCYLRVGGAGMHRRSRLGPQRRLSGACSWRLDLEVCGPSSIRAYSSAGDKIPAAKRFVEETSRATNSPPMTNDTACLHPPELQHESEGMNLSDPSLTEVSRFNGDYLLHEKGGFDKNGH